MIRIGDNNYRNLEEQVLKNKQDIANHYNVDRVLADFGIIIVGYAETPEELPDPETYTGNYGDGYYVGISNPYSFYIYTRPDPDAGYDTNYWLNIGPLAIAGPEGPKGDVGPEGPQGVRGSIWTSVYDTLPQTTNYRVNDQLLRTYDGNIYECRLNEDENKYWALIGNIQGPQGVQGIRGPQGIQGPVGPQGPQGPIGPTGKSITIIGEVSSASQLPDPSTVDRASAYLVTINNSKHIFLITGTDTLVWTDAGGFGGGSTILVNGAVVNEFNADTKLDKVTTNTAGIPQVYTVNTSGGQEMVGINSSSSDWSIARRYTDGRLRVGTPVETADATTKGYVDTALGNKLDKVSSTTSHNQIYGKTANGAQVMYDISDSPLSGGIVQRQPDGSIFCNTPTNEEDAANKLYVDEQTANLQPKLTAGTNITISNNTITAKDTKYTAGSGISISSSNVITNTRTAPTVPTYYMHNVRARDATNGVLLYASIINKSSTALTAQTLEAEIAKYTKNSSSYKMPLSGFVTKSGSNTTYGQIVSGYSRNDGKIYVEVVSSVPTTTTSLYEYTITTSNFKYSTTDAVVAIS